MGMQASVTRRDFVAGAAAGAAVLAAGAGAAAAGADEASQGFDAEYDVVVVGYGFAGGVSSLYAADAGAKVLLVDVAPEGSEGGNSRYCGQLTCYGAPENKDKLIAYYTGLGQETPQDPEVIEAYVDGLCDMFTIYSRLGVDDPCIWEDLIRDDPETAAKTNIVNMFAKQCPEYPEIEGGEALRIMTAEPGAGQCMLYYPMQDQVAANENIEVWLESPALHLIQDPETKAIQGVVVSHDGGEVRVKAGSGVVLACGGFENNDKMKVDYLGVERCLPLGGTYNKGDGIVMAQEVGADLWHMHNYESLGGVGGNNWEGTVDGRAKYITPFAMPNIASGALVCVGKDGTRFVREDQFTRHGKAYNHGIWSTQNSQYRPYLIMDEAQRQVIVDLNRMPDNWDDIAVSAETAEDLAALIDIDPATLARTVERFNGYAETGVDIEFDRPAETMRPFEGTLWAVALQPTVLNTQGGPRRNSKAQVIGLDGEPIPGLFSAGELGGMNAHYYNGGSNVAECLVSGRVAGTNAAKGVE